MVEPVIMGKSRTNFFFRRLSTTFRSDVVLVGGWEIGACNVATTHTRGRPDVSYPNIGAWFADHLPEWSIGWRSGRHVFVLVGSNPTVVKYFFLYFSPKYALQRQRVRSTFRLNATILKYRASGA